MRYAVIDVGSNTIRSQVYKFVKKIPVTLFTDKSIAGLVTYISDGRLTAKGEQKLITTLLTHLETIALFKVRKTFVFATAALRKISNLAEIKSAVKQNTNIDLVVLSQEEEAKLGYLGIQLSCVMPAGFSLDIGGGSTEIVRFNQREANVFLNTDFGSLSLYNDFVSVLLPTKQEVKKIDMFVKKNIKTKQTPHCETLIGIGGTIRAIGNIVSEYVPNRSTALFLYDDVLFLYKHLLTQKSAVIKTILQVSPNRIHTLVPGMIIVKNIFEKFNASQMQVCNTGLREGVLLSRLGKKE